ncbi:MAG TPA: DUF4476 domain-containing protein [Puia sp.]|nr:DUF4476 domain-containing protein [Puia sp.]
MQKPGLFGMNGFMVFLLTCLSFAAQAQQPGYLILMDAENKQPFVVRVGDQSYFSSSHGHLVLSQLKDSTYKLGLRFPRKNIAELVFTVAVHLKDLGFQLKGNDSSMVLFNWQTKEIIRPVYEKDSSRMLEQGIKRDDGFSRLMSAVVNDTAVMYNTYAGNGFGSDSAIANVQGTGPKTQSPNPDLSNSGSDKRSAIDQQAAAKSPGAEIPVSVKPPVVAIAGPGGQSSLPSNVNQQPATVNKDSLLTAKRQELHFQDSLNTARKTASRDSLISARKQQTFLRDSLNTARKEAIKDSMTTAKKRQAILKDSLVAVRKAAKDSLLVSRKNGASNAELLATKRIQKSNDSLLAVNKEKASKDSLLAANRMNFIRDSLELASGSTAGRHHSSLTQVKKLREVSLKISRKMVFLDVGNVGRTDTITLFVYFESADTVIKKRPGGEPIALKKTLPPDSTGVKKNQLTNKGLDTSDLSKTAKNRNTDTSSVSKMPLKNKNADTSGLNNTLVKKNATKTTDAPICGQAATESDTEALRSAILKANSEQEKIAVAAGAFAMKCFSVSQVRFLASLLVSDKARYGLMDAAHLHITDQDHFPELVDMLTDKNFQRKFLVMAEKRS